MKKFIWTALKLDFISSRGCSIPVVPNYLVLKESVYFSVVFTFVRELFIYFYPPYVALCASKAWQRFGSEKLSWCLETFLFLRLSSRDGNPSLPLLSLFLSFILFPTYFPRVGFFSGCLMSSGSIHKLYCGIYSTFKCSFDEIVWGGKSSRK